MEMSSEEKNCYANSFARFSLAGIEEVLGKNGINLTLKRAGLERLIDNYPPDDDEIEFPFKDFVALFTAIRDIYGDRAARVMELRAGRIAAKHILEYTGFDFIFQDPTFLALPLEQIITTLMGRIADASALVGDSMATFEERDDEFAIMFHKCGVCWEQESDQPYCTMITGVISYILRLIPDVGDIPVTEKHCIAMGDPYCEFVVPKQYEK
jgi:predicted hydrocarbon binding protein